MCSLITSAIWIKSHNSHRSQQVRLLTWLIRPQGRPEASVSAATAHAPLFCEWKPRHFPLNFTAFWELQWLFKSSEKLSSFRKYFWGSQFRFFYIHQNLTKDFFTFIKTSQNDCSEFGFWAGFVSEFEANYPSGSKIQDLRRRPLNIVVFAF